MLLVFCNIAFAQESIDSKAEIIRGKMAVLIADTGEKLSFEVKTETIVVLTETNAMKRLAGNINGIVYCKEFSVDIPAKAFGYTSQITDEAWDQSGGVKAWGRVYFQKSGDTVLVTGLEGNWRNNDGGASLYNHKAVMGTIGEGVYSNHWITQRLEVPVSAHFNISIGFTEPIRTNIAGALAGGTTMVDISRGSYHWNLTLPIVVIDNGIPVF